MSDGRIIKAGNTMEECDQCGEQCDDYMHDGDGSHCVVCLHKSCLTKDSRIAELERERDTLRAAHEEQRNFVGAMTAYAHELFVSWQEFGKLADRVRDCEERGRRLKDKLEQHEDRIDALERQQGSNRL